MEVSKIQPLNFKSSLSCDNKIETAKSKSNVSKKVCFALLGLAALGTLGLVAMNIKKNGLKLSNDNNIEEAVAKFKDRIAVGKNGEVFSGELIKTNSLNQKYTLSIENGQIIKSVKTLPDGTVEWIKNYSTDRFGRRIIEVLKPDESGEAVLSSKFLSSGSKIVTFNAQDEVERYYFKINGKFKRIDEFVDKKNNFNYITADNVYTQDGREINKFLRTGEFYNYSFTDGKVPYNYSDDTPSYIVEKVNEAKITNRTIADKIEELDFLVHSSKTSEEMTVYRDAPYYWLDKAKDGFLTEEAFCSTSTVPGASMEGMIGKHRETYTRYKIILPKGTPFLNLTHTSEKEMLLPRNAKFRVIDSRTLEYILE